MNYSIIVPTCNRQKDLASLMDSILKQTILPAEVIVIDQSECDDTKKYIDSLTGLPLSGNIDFIYIHQIKKSLVAARNKGIDLARGQIVSFLDDDVVLFENYYEKVLHYFDNDKKIGGLSGNIIIENKSRSWKGKIWRTLQKLFLLDNFDGKMTSSGFGYPIHGFEGENERPMQVEMLSGCNMNFRKELLGNDKFDEWFTGYSYREDAEFSYRISRKTVLKMIPEARLYHNYSRSNRMDIKNQKVMEVKNYYYFYKKHAKKTTISDFLFLHSLMGLTITYFAEYLCNCNKEKYKQLKGFIDGIIGLLKYKNNLLKK